MTAQTSAPGSSAAVPDLLAELASLADPKALAINQRHGDEHAVNLSKLRAIAKRLKTNHPLALELWATADPGARLLALLINRPKDYSAQQLDAMLREARLPKVHEWLVNYVVMKSPHLEELRLAWFDDADPVVASAGWALTSARLDKPALAKAAPAPDRGRLLDTIEAKMKEAPERLQWAMNQTLATIGIVDPELRPRAVAIGEALEVLKDYPTSPGCTSPFAPAWIAEIVRRREQD